jgi:hypothetical protein
MSQLDRDREVLVAHVAADRAALMMTAQYRDDLAYEVAVQTIAEEIVTTDDSELGPDRRGRYLALAAFGTLMVASAAHTMFFEPRDKHLPLPENPNQVIPIPGHQQRALETETRLLSLTTGRQSLHYEDASTQQAWNYTLPDDERIRDMALGPDSVALSTYNSGEVFLLAAADGKVLARFEIGEGASSVAVTDDRVFATRPGNGDIVVTDTAGRLDATVDVAGVPARIAVLDDGRVVVIATRSRAVQIVDPATLAVTTIDVGRELRSLAVRGSKVYSLAPETSEVVVVDVDSQRTRTHLVKDLSPGESSFAPSIAVSDRHLALPLYSEENPGVSGIGILDPRTLAPQTTLWTYLGGPLDLLLDDDTVYTGSTEREGLLGWTIPEG